MLFLFHRYICSPFYLILSLRFCWKEASSPINFTKKHPNATSLPFNACTSLTVLDDRSCNNESIFFEIAFMPSFVIICPNKFLSSGLKRHFLGFNFTHTVHRRSNVSFTSPRKESHFYYWWPWHMRTLLCFCLAVIRKPCRLASYMSHLLFSAWMTSWYNKTFPLLD